MKKHQTLITVLIIALSFFGAFAQTNTEKRIIEVTGSAETFITPNEFTFKITLLERIENKQKVTIEMQEDKLKQELSGIGVNVTKDLTVFDLTSVYVRQRRLKDTLGSKDYRLKLRDLEKIEKLQELADRLNVSKLDLIDSTHTDLAEFRKQTKIEAVKAARAKADYMLAAIGERVGKAVFIQESSDDNDSRSNYYSNNNSNISNITVRTSDSDSTDVLKFSQIKLRYAVLARFEIQ